MPSAPMQECLKKLRGVCPRRVTSVRASDVPPDGECVELTAVIAGPLNRIFLLPIFHTPPLLPVINIHSPEAHAGASPSAAHLSIHPASPVPSFLPTGVAGVCRDLDGNSDAATPATPLDALAVPLLNDPLGEVGVVAEPGA